MLPKIKQKKKQKQIRYRIQNKEEKRKKQLNATVCRQQAFNFNHFHATEF